MTDLHKPAAGTPTAVAVLIAALIIGEPVVAQVYWRNDTKFSFTRNDNRLSKCF